MQIHSTRTLAVLATVLVLLITAPVASAQDWRVRLVQSGQLTVGTSGTAPPFTMTDAQGNLTGFDVDVMTRIAGELALPLRWVQLEFSGLLPGLAAGRFDVVASGVVRTTQRLGAREFTLLSPYIVNGTAITRRAGDTRITGWQSVCGLRMGAVRGGVFQRIAMERLPAGCVSEAREYPSWTEMSLDLRNRRIDFMAHDYLGPNYQLAQNAALGVEVLPEVLEPVTQSLAVTAANPPLAQAIDAMLTRWRSDGTLDQMIRQRFGSALDWSLAR